ncbi:Arabinose metabolism transcriptional repressor [Anaerohalosphaera lusitana]|uniref:Arabinose metabolism transcriptional repressor n=1 Tax=Anaerohalosphaera lusitana TaxID=1936003 RepID=A0A1U9NLF2_9BACT|nr:GntR family transcriptional regulator [Anaerohalosphaera lusitana]AQT68761.1 Arabinose metabolism transcriptional repressor [Anaerohalosphaera lusitana]
MNRIANIQLDKNQNKSNPLYQQIRREVQKRIDTNEISAGDVFPSITFLAKEWNVAYRTIKSAFELLEQDGVVSLHKGKCIVANDGSGNGISSQTFAVSYITCHHDDPYYAIASSGIRRFMLEKGIEYAMMDVGNSRRSFLEAIENPGPDIDGLLVLPFELPGYGEAVQRAIDAGKKVVFLDRVLPGVEASSVECDHFSIAFDATTHLLELHGRPVYFLGFADKPSGARDWYKGWSRGMQAHNHFDLEPYFFDFLVGEQELASTLDVGLEYSIKAATRLFSTRKDDVYCIFSGNDFIARGIYIAAENFGLQIGKDVFVVGSNDMPFAAKMQVPLSSVGTVPSAEQLGYQAAKLLYEHLTGAKKNPVRQLLPVELKARQSSLGVGINKIANFSS